MTHLMVTNPFIRLDAARSAMPPYRASAATTPMGVFGPAKPGFFTSAGAALRPTCGRQDHGVERALPADAKSRSNRSKPNSFGITAGFAINYSVINLLAAASSVINVLQPVRRIVARIAGARTRPPDASTICLAFDTASSPIDITLSLIE